MATPRIFLSSTCYDLSDARAALAKFLEKYGFEVLNSETANFGVTPKVHSHKACLDEVDNADYLVLIIGGRSGGTFIGSENSITNEEVKLAFKREIPVLAFVDAKVNALRTAYRKNPTSDFTPVVDNVKIFDFIDFIASGHEDNWLHEYKNVTDIKKVLKHQFGHYLLLYSQGLRKKVASDGGTERTCIPFPQNFENYNADSLEEITEFRNNLKIVHSTLNQLLTADTKESVKDEQLKTIWLISRYGEGTDKCLYMNEDRFKSSAWSRTRGNRVFSSMEGTDLSGFYDVEEDFDGKQFGTVNICFATKGSDVSPAIALSTWVEELLKKHSADDARELFDRLDMRIFSND